PHIFAEHAMILSKKLAGLNTLVLIASSLTVALAVDAAQKGLRQRVMGCLFLTVLCAFGFMVIKYFEYESKLTHHTIVASQLDPATKKATLYVFDGHIINRTDKLFTLEGAKARVEQSATDPFDIHWMSEHGVEELAKRQESKLASTDIPGGG